jgi:hypothetical protein
MCVLWMSFGGVPPILIFSSIRFGFNNPKSFDETFWETFYDSFDGIRNHSNQQNNLLL